MSPKLESAQGIVLNVLLAFVKIGGD